MKNIDMFYHINLESSSVGGILTFLRGICNELAKEYKVKYYSAKYDDNIEINKNINTVYFYQSNLDPNKKRIIPHNLRYIIKLFFLSITKKNSDDNIMVFNRIDHTLPFVLKKSRKILIIHGSSKFDNLYYGKYSIKKAYLKVAETLAMKYMDNVILVSEDGLEYYKEKYKKYIDKFTYIPNFYDGKIFYPNLNNRINSTYDKIKFIYTGRFEKEKGMEDMLGFIDFLNSQNIKFEIKLIGEGSYKNRLESKKNVMVFPKMPQQEICYHLNESDIFLLFSKFEGTPLSLIESMAVGIPAITSYGGELSNLIKDGYNGFKFIKINESYEEILNKTYIIIKDKINYKKRCIEFSKKFQIYRIVKSYTKIIDRLMYNK